jgi:hypothetical protein
MNYNEKLLDAPYMVDARETLPRNPDKKWGTRDPAKLEGLVLHQSLEEHGSASGNARYHSGPNHISPDGLPGLSYTAFVEKDGKCYLANDVESKTYSQGYGGRPGDENAEFMGICFGGNFSGPGYVGTQVPTEEQLKTARDLWERCKEIWGWTNEGIYGHFDFGKPACPGYKLMELIEEIRPVRFSSVVEKQDALRILGFYKGTVDGIWGIECKAALVEFQKSAGLIPDGVWGKKTSAAVRDAMEK